MFQELDLDSPARAQRRRLVAARPGAFGLEGAWLAVEGELAELRLQFIPPSGPRKDSGVPPLLPGNLFFVSPTGARIATPHFEPIEPSAVWLDGWSARLRLPGELAQPESTAASWRLELTGVHGLDPLFSSARIQLSRHPASLFPIASPRPPIEEPKAPAIDYRAKDYASFLALMQNAIAARLPLLTEDSVTAQNVALLEMLAFVGDHLSYYQDAVATEAYLETSRRRVSVARHTQLLDYRLNEGTNSRVWVRFEVEAMPRQRSLPRGTAVFNPIPGETPVPVANSADLKLAVDLGAAIFETMEEIRLESSMNRLELYSWGLESYSIEQGATAMALVGPRPRALRKGRVLLLEAAEERLAHGVRITTVRESLDPVTGQKFVWVGWSLEDALPFPISWQRDDPSLRIYGNVVVADFGVTWPPGRGGEPLPTVPPTGPYRPRLPVQGLIFHVPFDAAAARREPAAAALIQDPRQALPAIELVERTLAGREISWKVRRNLLASGPFAPDFVVEVEDDGQAFLLLGDGRQGRRPESGSDFTVRYRIASGSPKLGRNALLRVALADAGQGPLVRSLANPLAATGASPAESTRHAALMAPRAWQSLECCIVPSDFVAFLESQPEVLHAAVELRSSGSWTTAFAFVQLHSGKGLDPPLRRRLAGALLSRCQAGIACQICDPIYLPLFAVLQVEVAAGFSRPVVRQALLLTFGTGELPHGGRGFFAPENFTFGQSLYLSQIVEAAYAVPGVAWARLKSCDSPGRHQPEPGVVITPGIDQILLVANDPDRPNAGRLDFELQGGS